MQDYISVIIENVEEELASILIARLSEMGFDGFEEEEKKLKAFIVAADYDESLVEAMSEEFGIVYRAEDIPSTNWNAVWESNFELVVVDDFVGVRASFHAPLKNVEQEILITPKMSFGTGHHATTWMMMKQMRDIDFVGKKVFDFGTGTGVLAILAAKLGAERVVAIDNDEWSIHNALENVAINRAADVEVVHGESAEITERFDIILANINRNILLDNMPAMAGIRSKDGLVLMSGLLVADEEAIVQAAAGEGLTLSRKEERNGWISLLFK